MPSTKNDSSGTAAPATPRFSAPETAAKNDLLAELIAQSERAVDLLLATTGGAAHDAAIAELAAESDAAMHHLLLLQQDDDAHAGGNGSPAHAGTGGTTT